MQKMILVFLITALFAGVGTVEAVTFPGTKTQAVLAQPDGSSPYYAWGTLGIDIGKKHDSDRQLTETARTKFAFDLRNIPGNVTITGVSLGYAVGNGPNGNYDFYITSIPDYTDPSTIFQVIPISTPVFSMITYGSGSLSSSDLTSLVNSKKGGYMYLGAYSDGESYSDSYANMSLTLFVTYTVNLIADNNFTVTGGSHGSIKVDGNTYTAPYPFSRYTGTNVTLQAISPQTDNQGYQQVWNTTSCDQSKWTRDNQQKTTNQTYVFAVAADDNGKTYLANFHQNRVTTSGTMSENETWVSVTALTGNVTVPSGIILTITSCAILNLSAYSIVSTGSGVITIQTGATLNQVAELTSSGNIVGLYPTIQAALSSASSGQSVIVPSGNNAIGSSTTVPSGVTLQFNSGSNLTFSSGTTLTVNGRVLGSGSSGQHIVFTGPTSYWLGLVINNSTNSSLQYCDFFYAHEPICATNCSNLLIDNCTFQNSDFYGTDAAALRFYNSSPNISSCIISGQSNSWSGIRFAQGSTGSLINSTIKHLGAGHGIIIQGNSAPAISNNTMLSPHYYGIIVTCNGTACPNIYSNTFDSCGTYGGGRHYGGIYLYQSTATIKTNEITNSLFGILCDASSSPTSGTLGRGGNVITNNDNGLIAYNSSNPIIGLTRTRVVGQITYYDGACNDIYNNTNYNVYTTGSCVVGVIRNWWGSAYPPTNKFYASGGSTIQYIPWSESEDDQC